MTLIARSQSSLDASNLRHKVLKIFKLNRREIKEDLSRFINFDTAQVNIVLGKNIQYVLRYPEPILTIYFQSHDLISIRVLTPR